MIQYRPCGACRSYVPADDGCEHWAPGLTAKGGRERERRAREREELAAHRRRVAEETAAFRRIFQARGGTA